MAFVACKKQDVKPEIQPRIKKQLYRWHVDGFAADSVRAITYLQPYGGMDNVVSAPVIDSSSIFVNDTLAYIGTVGYHVEFKPGDKIRFYFKGKPDKSSPDQRGFYFWQDKNEIPQVKFFKAEGDVVTGQFIIE